MGILNRNCKFCKKYKQGQPLYVTTFSNNRILFEFLNGKVIPNDNFECETIRNIKFCPLCGNKLKKAK